MISEIPILRDEMKLLSRTNPDTKQSGSQGYIDFVDRVRIAPPFMRTALADSCGVGKLGIPVPRNLLRACIL